MTKQAFNLTSIEAVDSAVFLATIERKGKAPALFDIALNPGQVWQDVTAIYEQPNGRTITRRIKQPRTFKSRGALGVAVREARKAGGLPFQAPWAF